MVILQTVKDTIAATMENHSPDEIAGVGVTNQRETTILWDRVTGEPLHNAIGKEFSVWFCLVECFGFVLVWSDTRTTHLVDRLKLELDENVFKKSCGLPLANYFSAVKIKYLIDNNDHVRRAISERRCLFGTVDSWIIWVWDSFCLFLSSFTESHWWS
jgi:glycerol kinase